jgi:hypothetical protein
VQPWLDTKTSHRRLPVATSLLPTLSISYRTSVNMSTTTAPTPEAIASVTALYDDMRAKARPLVDKFEARYTAWKQTWEKSVAYRSLQ